ncbi:MAG: transglycosylase SLT domain-containing protein [Synergistaceae bacterium]|jgi:soluble lytic murein transglycosylase|nr:transglycosylase SLT domain-containing protein [Synergistaceae bacterium]
MFNLSKKNFLVLASIAAAAAISGTLAAAAPLDGDRAMSGFFEARDWRAMDSLYDLFVSGDASDVSSDARSSLSARGLSIYANALWRQGRYERGVSILESIQQDLPDGVRPYAKMLLILGAERAGRRDTASEAGAALWDDAPGPLRYYLAYAMARIARDTEKPGEALVWFRRMLESAPDKKRAIQALSQMITLDGVTPDEAASLLIASPGDARASALLDAMPEGTSSKAEYARGYLAYARGKHESAIARFQMASADAEYGEAARYYWAYSAYMRKDDDQAYSLWSKIALDGFDYPQRSVRRLQSLAGRAMRENIVELLLNVADKRADDYPELAADALVSVIRLSGGKTAEGAMEKLFSAHAPTPQAAAMRWEKGWEAWKGGRSKTAFDHWSAGYTPELGSTELASRLLYWSMRALERLNSPVAAERVKKRLVEGYPAEYYTFLADPGGGIKPGDVPASLIAPSELEDWGFAVYARLEAMIPPDATASADMPSLYRASRLAAWEDDFSSSVRTFAVLQRLMPREERGSSELLKNAYPRAFERDVLAASESTGVEPAVIWGIMRQESMYEPDVTSSAGAYGLMQLMPGTAKGEAAKLKMASNSYLRAPDNILLGANHISGLIARFKEMPLALAAYNAGGTPVTRWSKGGIEDMPEWVEDISYSETRGYVKAVLRNIAVYWRIYPSAK